MRDFNALLDKIKNPIVLIIFGVGIFIFDWSLKSIISILIVAVGFSMIADKITEKLKVPISNFFYSLKKKASCKNSY